MCDILRFDSQLRSVRVASSPCPLVSPSPGVHGSHAPRHNVWRNYSRIDIRGWESKHTGTYVSDNPLHPFLASSFLDVSDHLWIVDEFYRWTSLAGSLLLALELEWRTPRAQRAHLQVIRTISGVHVDWYTMSTHFVLRRPARRTGTRVCTRQGPPRLCTNADLCFLRLLSTMHHEALDHRAP